MKIILTEKEYKALRDIAMQCSFEQVKEVTEYFKGNPYVTVEKVDKGYSLEWNEGYMVDGLKVAGKYVPAMIFNIASTVRLYQSMDKEYDGLVKKWDAHMKIMNAPTVSMEELDNLDKPAKK